VSFYVRLPYLSRHAPWRGPFAGAGKNEESLLEAELGGYSAIVTVPALGRCSVFLYYLFAVGLLSLGMGPAERDGEPSV